MDYTGGIEARSSCKPSHAPTTYFKVDQKSSTLLRSKVAAM